MNAIIRREPSPEEMLAQMRRDARYDVADADDMAIPDLSSVMTLGSPSPPPKVPKSFLSNDCAFNCAYCGCRCSRDAGWRYVSEPRRLARLAIADAEKARRGIFLTSAVYKNADTTQELIVATVRAIRELGYRGYLHAKVMPGADPRLIKEAGQYANRLSVNIEVARSEGYAMIAKQKSRASILTPMQAISDMIRDARGDRVPFASTQTTQLMAGSTGEDDRAIITLAGALYRKYRLQRVYYTAFQYRHPAKGYDLPPVDTPVWRMKRLYQADRLIKLYGFSPEELAPDVQPFLEPDLDPKSAWALRNLHLFPVEINRADFDTLTRVPGIGLTYARRIVEARRMCSLSFDALSKLGVSLKRSAFFITCNGRYAAVRSLDSPALRGKLATPAVGEQQLSLLSGFEPC